MAVRPWNPVWLHAWQPTLSYKLDAAPSLGILAGLLEQFPRYFRGTLALLAERAHQTLSQDAVERGNKIIGLDAHIQEAAQHVHHVVRVYGSENQVARQGRLDGDLRSLVIANLAHHDLVRIVAQDGPAGRARKSGRAFRSRESG